MADSEREFRSFLRARDLDVERIGVVDAVTAWIDFYKERRADDVAEGMDWLWFQYGAYDFGDGPSFQVDLTRQFILDGATDDDAIWQMHFVLHFPPDLPLPSGMETCEDPTDASADRFRDDLLAGSVLVRVRGMAPDRVELFLENAG
jgi:hypothetical protein